MSAGKTLNEWGVLIKEEASYGAGGTLSPATDGVLVLEQPTVTYSYIHDGQRRGERGPMNLGIRRAKKLGRAGQVTLVHEAAGAGAAYSASQRPSAHTLLRICGFDAQLTTTSGQEKYTYTPGTGTSGVLEVYTRGQKYLLKGAYGDLVIAADGPGIPSWEVAVQALADLPTDAAVPAITYPTVQPPVAEQITLQLGTFAAAVVRSFRLELQRELSPRANINAAGHAGFTPGARRPRLQVVIEAASLVASPYHSASGIDPYQLTELASAISVSLQVGSTQYNRWRISAPNAQLAEPVEEAEDGATATWTLTWDLLPSTPAAKDGVSIVFD